MDSVGQVQAGRGGRGGGGTGKLFLPGLVGLGRHKELLSSGAGGVLAVWNGLVGSAAVQPEERLSSSYAAIYTPRARVAVAVGVDGLGSVNNAVVKGLVNSHCRLVSRAAVAVKSSASDPSRLAQHHACDTER